MHTTWQPPSISFPLGSTTITKATSIESTAASRASDPITMNTFSLVTSVLTESVGPGTDSVAPITIVVTTVYRPSTDAEASASSTVAELTSILTSTLQALPLTTIFTPPASCSTLPFTLTASDDTTAGVWRYRDDSADPCYPPLWATAKANHYTPGACPEGHTYARISRGLSSASSYTSVNCCPKLVGTNVTETHRDIGH